VLGVRKTRGEREVMRETAEYAIGIFHGSIMTIQSGGAAGASTTEFVLSTRHRRRGLSAWEGRRGRIGRGRVPASAATSSRMRFPSQRDPVGVFFPFPGNRMQKDACRSSCTGETGWNGAAGGLGDHDGCESASLSRWHLGIRGCEVKTDGNGLLRNL